MAKGFFVLCFCVCVQLVYCQFGFFNQPERQSFNFAKGLGSIRETFGGILRPNHGRPITNDGQQNGRPNYPQNQNFNQGSVLFPTSYPNEAPNYGHGNNNQGNDQGTFNQGNNQETFNQGNNQGTFNQGSNQGNDQAYTQSPFPDQDQSQGNQGQVNFVNNDGSAYQQDQSQGSQDQPGQGNVNFVNNDGSSSAGSYNGPNDAVEFNQGSTEDPYASTPETESRNSFNFAPVPMFYKSCRTINGGTGSCINLYSCQPFLKVLQESRNNPSAVKMLQQAHCGFEGSNPMVCCPLAGIPTAAPVRTTTTPAPTTTTPAPKPAPTAAPKAAGDFLPNLPSPPVCGFSNTTLSRVVGGIPAKLGAFPWMALLGYKRADDTRWLCGGSLISSRHVLTAAHCIHNHEKDLYLVRLGELDLAREDEGANPIDVLIKQQVKHENYNPKAFTNDIALLVLEQDVQFTNLIKPICIPTATELRARTFEDYNPLIAGWGDTEFRGPAATHLQVLQLPVVSNEFCQQAYSAYKNQQIDEKVLCAGFKLGGKDACQGDSGGPLMQPIWNAEELSIYMYQIGVVSFGKKCAEAGFPGVYSRVTYFVPWIEEKVVGFASRYYLVRLGELDLAREDEGANPIDVLIKQQVKHENYNPKAFTNDIALLVLEQDVQFTNLIKPICIPTATELRARTFEDYNPLIAGWGDTEFRGPAATHLQVLQLPVVSNEFCQQAYSAYKNQQIDEKVLCAGFKLGGKDACQGDSGGPLMQPIWNAEELSIYMYQIGVVSFGKKCAEAGFPGVYSRVTYFVPWIEEKVVGFASR